MADGSLIIETRLDNKKLHSDLANTRKQIDKLQEKLTKKQGDQTGLKADFEVATEAAAQTERTIAKLKAEIEETKLIANGKAEVSPDQFIANGIRQKEITAELKEQEKTLKSQDKEAERLGGQYTKITDEVKKTEQALEQAKNQAGELAQEIARRETGISGAMYQASDAVDKFSKRLVSLAKRAFVFSVITMALKGRSLKIFRIQLGAKGIYPRRSPMPIRR